MYDIKYDLIKYSILSVPLFIITGGHAVIALFFCVIIPYHIYCNAQEKKRKEEEWQKVLEHQKEQEAENWPYMVQVYMRYMMQGEESAVPERHREYIRKRVEEYRASKEKKKAAQFVLGRPPVEDYRPMHKNRKTTNSSDT
jgi:hypothetical protein